MPRKKEEVLKKAAARKGKAAPSKVKNSAKSKAAKTLKPKAKKALKPAAEETAQVLGSETVFDGPVFQVVRDHLIEPGGKEATRDIIHHNGSAVILAIDHSKSKKDPWIVMERQYRHAANSFLWELPAGKLEPGEDSLEGAKRELAEETGYRAKTWKFLAEYYASPGFLGEAMQIYVAEGLTSGDTHWDGDEQIEFRLVKLSEILKLIEKGAIPDGKTLTGVLLYARKIAGRRRK